MLLERFRVLCAISLLTTFFVLLLWSACGSFKDVPVYLRPPGLRSIKDPTVVIPAIHRYLNQPPARPAYRHANGDPAEGWVMKYVSTRRFSSDQSAWIYYRLSDLMGSKTIQSFRGSPHFRIWPVGTTIVLESYQGDATMRDISGLSEVFVMHKTRATGGAPVEAFYSANWSYARFTPQGELSINEQRVIECHQCHSIAFHITGDLTFTQFP